MRETWYVLEDGKVVDPRECAVDDKGALAHVSGVRVAMRFSDCPMSRSVDPKAELVRGAPVPELNLDSPARDMKPEHGKRHYKTRESKVN